MLLFWTLALAAVLSASASEDRECLVGIGVLSKSSHFERREVIRNTWFKYPSVLSKKACVVFVSGLPSDDKTLAKLKEEIATHNDLVLTGSAEGWERLTWQTLRMHEYFEGKAHWVVKTDDDTMIRVDRLVEYIEAEPNIKAIQRDGRFGYVGWKVNGAPVHRQGRYMLTYDEYKPEELPEYMSGPAYMVSGSLTDQFVEQHRAGKLNMLKLEDIAVALWVQDLRNGGKKIETIDNRAFYKIRVCHDMAFSVLLEEGRPLMLDAKGVADAMREIVENDRVRKPNACPYATTLEAVQERNKKEQEAAEKKNAPASTPPPAPTPAPTPAPAKSSKKSKKSSEEEETSPVPPLKKEEKKTTTKKSKKSKRDPVKVVLYDDPRGYHPYLHPSQQKCDGLAGTCEIAITEDKAAMEAADGVVFLGDNEIYGHNGDRPLPARVGSAPWLFVFREAAHKFPAQAWGKYDHSITYRTDDYVTYSYMEDLDEFLAQSQRSLASKPKHYGDNGPIAYVSLRCGDRPTDESRKERTNLVRQLGSHVQVDSYGVCLRNKTWPEGHDRDKFHVMHQHKFCIAFENSFDTDYVTEKMFDCLRAAAIPIYNGPRSAIRFAPGGRESVIFVSDYGSVEELAEHIKLIDRSDALWQKYTRWISEPPKDWIAFMRTINNRDVGCRLCRKLAEARS